MPPPSVTLPSGTNGELQGLPEIPQRRTQEVIHVIKYKGVKFNEKRILALYKAGKNVAQIAVALGYPRGAGQTERGACLS